jgi:hypothetical protein
MDSGIDLHEVAKAWPAGSTPPPMFNCGLGASEPVEHYLLARQAFAHHDDIRMIVYGYYDLQLSQAQPGGWDDLVGNRAMSYSVDPATAAALYAPGEAWQKWRFELIGAIPLLANHAQLWKLVEIFRRGLEDFGLPAERTNEFGRAEDFEEMAAPHLEYFKNVCRAGTAKPEPLVPAVRALIDLARAKKARLILVEMPMTSEHRTRYYDIPEYEAYRMHIQEALAKERVPYVGASDFAEDSGFDDGLHLNEKGAAVFSAKMAPIVAAALAQP